MRVNLSQLHQELYDSAVEFVPETYDRSHEVSREDIADLFSEMGCKVNPATVGQLLSVYGIPVSRAVRRSERGKGLQVFARKHVDGLLSSVAKSRKKHGTETAAA